MKIRENPWGSVKRIIVDQAEQLGISLSAAKARHYRSGDPNYGNLSRALRLEAVRLGITERAMRMRYYRSRARLLHESHTTITRAGIPA